MKNENATKRIEALSTDITKNADALWEIFLMYCCVANGAQLAYEGLLTMRKVGGMARKVATILQNGLVLFVGYLPPSGDDPASFTVTRSKAQCTKYAKLGYSEGIKRLNASNLTLFYREKKEKELDPKAEAVKAIGGWASELIMFIRTHKQEIIALKQAAKSE